MNTLGPDNAFWIDGEWLSWDDIPDEDSCGFPTPGGHMAQLEYEAELRLHYPKAVISLVPIFRDLLALAERYFLDTGQHLQVYGDLGELFGAITYGIKLHRNYAMGSDGRLGDDFVEIKTITPFKKKDAVTVRLDRHFSKVLVVKITENFGISGRLIDRRLLPKQRNGRLRLTWRYLNQIE